MNRSSAAAWRRARTLDDLAALNVRRLDGDVRHSPCGQPGPETAPLATVLQALNCAGLVTSCSQPGRDAGSGREQRAYVAGFAGPGAALALSLLARDAGVTAVIYDPGRLPRTDRARLAVQVSRPAITPGRPGGAGSAIAAVHLSRGTIAAGWDGISDDAVTALCGAWQVTLIDPEWGRPLHLFNILAVWAASVLPAPVLIPA